MPSYVRLRAWLGGILLVAVMASSPGLAATEPRVAAGEYLIELKMSAPTEVGLRAAQAAKPAVAEAARAVGAQVKVYNTLPYIYAAGLSSSQVRALRRRPDVRAVHPVVLRRPFLQQSLALVGQARAASVGATGAGFSVAVLDTGGDPRQSDLGACTPGSPGCRILAAFDAAPDDGLADDNTRHGTNVASIVGRIAPEAGLILIDVFDGVRGSDRDIVAGLDWVYQNRIHLNIAAVNLSLGSEPHLLTCTGTPYDAAFELLNTGGVSVVVASGNEAKKRALATPACHPRAVGVGVTTDAPLPSTKWEFCTDPALSIDRPTCFSNSARSLRLLAPGHLIDAGGLAMSGTSQAAPHVAGAIAALRSSKAARTSAEAVALLQTTGRLITDSNGVTTPRMDLAAAVNKAPVAADDAARALQGGGVVMDVLANDQDETPTRLALEVMHTPNGVSAEVVGRRLFVLIDPGASGAKVLRYRVKDEFGVSAEARVTITIAAAALPQPREVSAGKSTAITSVRPGTRRYLVWDQLSAQGRTIYQQEIDAGGAAVGERLTVKANATVGADWTLAAGAAGDRYAIAWVEGGPNTPVMAVNYEFPLLGQPYWSSFADRLGPFETPTVAGLDDRVVIGWHRHWLPNELKAQAAAWGAQPPPEGPLQTLSPFVGTVESRAVSEGAKSYLLFGRTLKAIDVQRFDGKGSSPWSGRRRLTSAGEPAISQFDVTGLPGGGFTMAWVQQDSPADQNLYVQWFGADANALSAPRLVARGFSGAGLRLARLEDGTLRLGWSERYPKVVAALSQSVSEIAVGPLVIDTWSRDAAKAPGEIDLLPLAGGRYLLTWIDQAQKVVAQVRQEP